MKKKIFITTSSFAEYDKSVISELAQKYEIQFNPLRRTLNKKEMLELLVDIDAVIAGTEIYDEEVLKKLTKIKIISRCGTGTDSIDLLSAKKMGVQVLKTGDCHVKALAELTVALMLDISRKVSLMDRKMRTGEWSKKMGNLIFSKKIGIIGFGRTGRYVAKLLSGFGVEIAYSDAEKQDVEYVYMSKQEILQWADILTIHVNATPKEFYLSREELSQVKESAIIINTSRGNLIDEEALQEGLVSGKIAGAALDVFSKEPYKGKLLELDNLVVTPHVGSYAVESRIEMESEAVKNLLMRLEQK